MKMIVLPPVNRNSFAASSKTFLTSFTPLDVALSSLKRDFVVFATIRANVVFPTWSLNPNFNGPIHQVQPKESWRGHDRLE